MQSLLTEVYYGSERHHKLGPATLKQCPFWEIHISIPLQKLHFLLNVLILWTWSTNLYGRRIRSGFKMANVNWSLLFKHIFLLPLKPKVDLQESNQAFQVRHRGWIQDTKLVESNLREMKFWKRRQQCWNAAKFLD